MTDLDRDNLQRVIDNATPQQLAAMVNIYWRVRTSWEESETNLNGHPSADPYTYQQWLNHARPKWNHFCAQDDYGIIYIAYYNMVMGIEPDGHCHT